jgi:hypothetical protein
MTMSHHFDSPTAIADGRLNLCDVYAFGGGPGSTVLVMSVNPDAGSSSPITFRPDAVYQFALDPDGGVQPRVGLRIRFAEPDAHGRQRLQVLHASPSDLWDAGAGDQIGTGITGSESAVTFPGLSAGKVWAGLTADPFWADGAALFAFLQAAHDGRFTPEVFAEGSNIFQGRNVTAIVLEIPDTLLGTGRSSVWATITLYGHAPARQVSRMGQPMLRPLFFNVPGPDTDQLNAGDPGDDEQRYADRITVTATRLASIAGHQAPQVHARHVARAFLPDVLGYTPGEPARFWPGDGNGRSLTDDAFGSAITFATGHPIADSVSPGAPVSKFPYLEPPHRGELPPLAELFGLRPAGADPGRSPQNAASVGS